MKNKIKIFVIATTIFLVSCYSYPVDDTGRLITNKETCYMSTFNLLGTDHQNVLVTIPTVSNGLIDTVECTVNAVAVYGTNLKKVKPYCSVTDDITVSPFMGRWVDFSEPMKYTLTSGNQKIKKEYTITITVQE